jgi:dTDP-4-amino-4,6-dideoxygalactose transaminase
VFLLAQLDDRDVIQQRRKAIWEYYFASLQDLAAGNGVGLPVVPQHCEQAYHMFYLVARTSGERSSLIEHLRQRSIHAVFHYLPLHLSEMGRRFGGRQGQCPVAESISERLVRLPFFTAMTREEQEKVVSAVESFYAA